MPGDRVKSRERKAQRAIEQWGGGPSWHIFKRCELCGHDFVVNNWEDKRPRTPRIFKRVCCPWCAGRRGKLRMAEHILVERMAAHGCEFQDYAYPVLRTDPTTCKCLFCIARRLIEKAHAAENRP